MPSDSGDHRRTTTTKPHHLGAAPPEPEHLPCPRCDSTNTKFCYYNNYNFSQPRHFCKACRRYWTHGGTLRDIPVGGGNRKNAKRSRVAATSHNFSTEFRHMAPPTAAPIMIPFAGDHGGAFNFLGDGKLGASMWGSFTSLLNSTQGPAFFGHGVGGFEDASFGLGRSTWPFGDDGVAGHATANGGGGGSVNTWQMDSGDCFSMPDIAAMK